MWEAFVDVIQGRFFCHSADNFKLSVSFDQKNCIIKKLSVYY